MYMYNLKIITYNYIRIVIILLLLLLYNLKSIIFLIELTKKNFAIVINYFSFASHIYLFIGN